MMPTLDDLWASILLDAVCEALYEEMALCPCATAPHGHALCSRCDCVASVMAAARDLGRAHWCGTPKEER
jgi:hypothetical protein